MLAEYERGDIAGADRPVVTGGMMVDAGTMATVARVFNVVGFAGSLRHGSYNRALLRAATELAPSALHIVIHELDVIPLYNGDTEAEGTPASVVQLRDAIRQADGLLIATPEGDEDFRLQEGVRDPRNPSDHRDCA